MDNRGYDSRYQIGSWTLGGILSYTHTYNNDGNLTGRTDNLNGANSRTFGYDGAHRLTQASGPWGSGTACTGAATYTYDKNGNRLCKGESASATSYTYTGGTNRLSSSSGVEVASYFYDLNGNTTGDGAHTYQYNDADRLTTVDAGATATYTYDAEGHRVIKVALDATTHFFYDPEGALLTEVGLDDASGKDYLYLGDAPLARVDWFLEQPVDDALRCSGSVPNVHLDWSLFPPGGNTYVVRRKLFSASSLKTFAGNTILATVQDPTQSFDDPVLGDVNNYLYRVFRRGLAESLSFYHADHLDTPIAMTGSGATFVWRAEPLPFGGIESFPASLVTNNLRFSGQYADSETLLHQNWRRDYSRRTGRFVEPDPIGLDGESPSLYTYALNDPTNLMDVTGLRVTLSSGCYQIYSQGDRNRIQRAAEDADAGGFSCLGCPEKNAYRSKIRNLTIQCVPWVQYPGTALRLCGFAGEYDPRTRRVNPSKDRILLTPSGVNEAAGCPRCLKATIMHEVLHLVRGAGHPFGGTTFPEVQSCFSCAR